MKDHAILDEQDALTEAGGIGIMGYHQDRSLFVTIQAGQLLHKTSCVLRIQRKMCIRDRYRGKAERRLQPQ